MDVKNFLKLASESGFTSGEIAKLPDQLIFFAEKVVEADRIERGDQSARLAELLRAAIHQLCDYSENELFYSSKDSAPYSIEDTLAMLNTDFPVAAEQPPSMQQRGG